MDFIKNLASCFLLVMLSNEVLANSDLTVEDLSLPPDQWERKCKQVKLKFGGLDHKSGVFTEFKHPVNESLSVSFLKINELEIPLLKGSYEQPSISIDGNSVSMRLVELNGLVLIFRTEDLQFIEDVWAKVDRESGEQISSGGGVKYTSAIYGGPASSIQMEIDAFTYASKDLACRQATRLKDVRIILALESKAFKPSIDALPMIALLENKGLKLMVEFEETSSRFHLGITSLLGSKLHTVSYYFKKDQAEVMYDIAALLFKMNE